MEEQSTQPSFEELLEQSERGTLTKVQTGKKITGTVVALSKGVAYIDIGMRTEAVLPLEGEDSRFAELREGLSLDVFIAKPSGQVRVALDPILGFGDFSALEDAFENNQSVEGKVTAVISGGYDVNIAGVKCFCPHSQINDRPVSDPRQMVGQELAFKIIRLEANSSNVVLSRRALQEEKNQQQIEETRRMLVVGAVMTGTVRDLQSYGAFVDLGGIQGLLHVSQISHANVERVEDVLSPGQEVEVKILDLSVGTNGKQRISLSIKALLPDPWQNHGFEPGDRITGTVARKSNFGIFISLKESLDGLLPRRLMRQEGRAVDMDSFEPGQSIEVEVVDTYPAERKITLALPGWNEEISSDLRPGDRLQVEVLKVLPAGILVQGVEDPIKGLIHKRTLKDGAMKSMLKDYPNGARFDAVLEDIDAQGRYNFALFNEANQIDRNTAARFMDTNKGLEQNPFASFFKPGADNN